MNLKLKELLDIPGCPMEFHGNQKRLESKPDGLSIDSRTLRPGEVFFAIRGEHQDGHAFVEAAIGKGALAVVVERRWWKKNAPALQAHACFVVRDTLRALQEIAAHYRRKFALPVVGLTGTNGKTTTKELVAAVLARLGDVCKTEGNLNNHLGVPLTLARLQKSHRALVVEMGTNHFGEIARLCEIAAPDSGLITNIGHGHTEFFENIDGVARAKMELFQFLADTGGTAFVNADDPVLNNHLPRLSKKITYG
ncbi:MAG: UDP-N-acetylmuramoyl-tripeptide--D-alanyl-D-alanine ligase, partial [Calditrichaeota bacterium]